MLTAPSGTARLGGDNQGENSHQNCRAIDDLSYRPIARNVGLSKNTVMEIVQRAANQAVDPPPAVA